MEECDEISQWCVADSWLVTIYWTEQITLAEHLIRNHCSHLSPLGAGMEEFAPFALPCLDEDRTELHCPLHTSVVFSLCVVFTFFCSSLFFRASNGCSISSCCIHSISSSSPAKPQKESWPHAVQQHAADQKQVDVMASSRSSYKQTAHGILVYGSCYKHIDYSIGFAVWWSADLNAVLKAFPALKRGKTSGSESISLWQIWDKNNQIHISIDRACLGVMLLQMGGGGVDWLFCVSVWVLSLNFARFTVQSFRVNVI